VDPGRGFRIPAGDYTRFGDVRPLLAAADDRFVVMAPGDEVALRFDLGPLGPVAPGRARTFVLDADGYCKDMDLLGAAGETVEPLPFHAMTRYPYGADERAPALDAPLWNTRRLGR
jgi:hypothetical protein